MEMNINDYINEMMYVLTFDFSKLAPIDQIAFLLELAKFNEAVKPLIAKNL